MIIVTVLYNLILQGAFVFKSVLDYEVVSGKKILNYICDDTELE